MPEIELTAGLGASPMPGGGGFTMEHGTHSQPIGVLNPFAENVSPNERESSTDWSADKPIDVLGEDPAADGDEDDRDSEQLSMPGESGAISGGENISRLDRTTYGPRSEPRFDLDSRGDKGGGRAAL